MRANLGYVYNHFDHPTVGGTLFAAGLVPPVTGWFNTEHLSSIYYGLLIIPAAYHFGVFISNTIKTHLKRWRERHNKQ